MKKTLLNTALAGAACAFSAASFANTAVATPAGGATTTTTTTATTTTPAASAYSTGQVQGQLGVELTIGKGCEVVNGATTANNFGTLSFGEVSALTSAIDGQAKGTAGAVIKLNCTSGVNYSVSLDNGRNMEGDTRRMAMTGQQGVEYVPYVLYQDAARQKAWDSKNPYTGNGSGGEAEMVVYGRIPAMAKTPGSGKYSDVVTMTVSW